MTPKSYDNYNLLLVDTKNQRALLPTLTTSLLFIVRAYFIYTQVWLNLHLMPGPADAGGDAKIKEPYFLLLTTSLLFIVRAYFIYTQVWLNLLFMPGPADAGGDAKMKEPYFPLLATSLLCIVRACFIYTQVWLDRNQWRGLLMLVDANGEPTTPTCCIMVYTIRA